MHRMHGIVVVLVCLMLVVGSLPASGQRFDPEQAAKAAWKQLLTELDANKDGKLSRAEFGKAWKDQATADEKFKPIDANKDGFIVEAEYVAWVKKAAKGK
jgi:Ca2+-binding EF-hand superfamily protein